MNHPYTYSSSSQYQVQHTDNKKNMRRGKLGDNAKSDDEKGVDAGALTSSSQMDMLLTLIFRAAYIYSG